MGKLFIPYADNIPCAVDIKGHRLLIVSTDLEDLDDSLGELGGDEVRELTIPDESAEQTQALTKLADAVRGGVVLTPPGISSRLIIENLLQELPWVH